MFSRLGKWILCRFPTLNTRGSPKFQIGYLHRSHFSTTKNSNQARTDSFVDRVKSIPPNGYFLLMFPCITLYLGIWQIRRRKWKLALIEEMDRKRRL